MFSELADCLCAGTPFGRARVRHREWFARGPFFVFALLGLLSAAPASAVVLWSNSGTIPAHETGAGHDILNAAAKRDDASNDTLYFKFHINPQSDATTEEYFAAFELFEGDTERLGIGNALKAWGYSAFYPQANPEEPGAGTGYVDLRSSSAEASGSSASYEMPHRGVERTIVFKVQYVAGGDDVVTVWLNPDLSSGANEVYQSESLTTRFNANASFDEIRLRHGGGGPGWLFSDLTIATTFNDFVDTSSAKTMSPPGDGGFSAQQLSFQSWQLEAGMPRSPIRAMAQSRNEYLWLGSDDGVTRFDGARFIPLNEGTNRIGAVTALLEDSNGGLWIGTCSNGLLRYWSGTLTACHPETEFPSNHITALAEDADGRIWVGTTDGLQLFGGVGKATTPALERLTGHRIAAMCSDGAQRIWIGAEGVGIFSFSDNELKQHDDPLVDKLLERPHCLLADRTGRLWVGAESGFVLCFDGVQWHRFRVTRHSQNPIVDSLAEEADGTIWAGSATEGLFRFQSDKMTSVSAGLGLAENQITSLFADKEGCLWVGGETGLSRLHRRYLFTIGRVDGAGHGAVHGMAEVAPCVVWVVKPGEGIFRWEGRSFNRLTAAGLAPGDPGLGPILVTRDGACWVACSEGLMLYRDPQAVADEGRLLALKNVVITALSEDSRGRIWVGGKRGGVHCLERGAWTTPIQLSITNAITAIVPDEDGAVWIGTLGSGLFRVDGSSQTRFGQRQGLRSDVIRTLYRDSMGVLWIGTDKGGLGCWENGRMSSLTIGSGGSVNTVSQILEDDSGRIWLGGDHGIVCIDQREFVGSVNEAELSPLRVYGRSEGIPSEECTTGFFPAGLKTSSGLLWFSTQKGVVLADPRQLPSASGRPNVILEDVLVDGVPSPGFKPIEISNAASSNTNLLNPRLKIPHGKHRIEFHYTTVNFNTPEQLRFRYQLEGLDAEWVEAGPRRIAFYNYVPPGEFSFRVAAAGNADIWSRSDPVLRIEVSRHFWQSPWFFGGAATCLVFGVGVTVRLVEKRSSQRRLKRLEQERALEHERRRIAQDLHDEMGAKLCRISFLSEHAQRNNAATGEVREQITTIADASRELLHTLDEIVWAVNPQNDTLEHVASYINQYAQNYFHSTGIDCELDMPDQFAPHPVSSQMRHHLFLAVHEVFTNILKHSGANRASVSLQCEGNTLKITIQDNGRGFDLAAQLRSATEAGNLADGLLNIQERMASIGGTCQMTSSAGQGTTTWFTLPLSNPEPRKDIA